MVFIGVLTFLSNHTMKLLVRMALHTHRTRGERSLLHRTDGDSSADALKNASIYGATPGGSTFDAPMLIKALYSQIKTTSKLIELGAWVSSHADA